MPKRAALALASGLLASLPILLWAASGPAQEQLPWQRRGDPQVQPRDDAYRPGRDQQRYQDPDDIDDPRGSNAGRVPRPDDAYAPRAGSPRANDAYSPRASAPSPYSSEAYRPPSNGYGQGYDAQRGPNDAYSPRRNADTAYGPGPQGQPYPAGQPYNPPGAQGYAGPGQPYTPGPGYNEPTYGPPGRNDGPYGPPPRRRDGYAEDGYSSDEILGAGHRFFGSVSHGMAKVVEYAFQSQGRPNGYVLGQDAGGAFIAGLRYGEGTLYTKDAGSHRVYWQGPSIGYDAGAEGSKVMMLVYNLRDPADLYHRFGGVDGSAYLVGGVGLTFQKSGDVVVAPIRAGVGLRFGANVGYLKYTRRPTWNPF